VDVAMAYSATVFRNPSLSPKRYFKAKKVFVPLGVEVTRNSTYPNDYIIYWNR
jgi:hypothetical protein